MYRKPYFGDDLIGISQNINYQKVNSDLKTSCVQETKWKLASGIKP